MPKVGRFQSSKHCCQGINRNGIRCKRKLIKPAIFCWQHKITRNNDDAPWICKPFNQFLLGVFALIATVYFGYRSPSKMYVGNRFSKLEEKIDNMKRIDVTDSDRLLEQYPLGYALFVISTDAQRHIVTPYPENRLKTDLIINWKSINVTELSENIIAMTPPDVGNIVWRNLQFQINRRVGEPVDILRFRNRDAPEDKRTIVTIEVLEDLGDKGVICLMGFRKDDEAKKFPEHQEVKFGVIHKE